MLLMSGPLGAQLIPGALPPTRDARRAQYLDTVLQGIRATDKKWLTAWQEDDVAGCAGQYVEDAFIITPEGDRGSGRDSITGYLTEALPRSGSLVTSLVDVDGSDRMVMTLENFVLFPFSAENPTLRGVVVTVYKSDGRVWRIRSQVFRPEPTEAS